MILKKIFSLSTVALLTALTLSGIAAWYSILGLTAIFAAAVIPIIIMGAALELAKVVTTVWLHRYWDKAGWLMKLYLVPAVIVLALITSMGIFGFLSKAHLDQAVPTGDVAAQVMLIDERIDIQRQNLNTQRTNIEAARTSLQLLDEQITARMGMGFDTNAAERAVQIRRQQRQERESLQQEIQKAQDEIQKINANIAQLNEEKLPVAAQLRKVEAEVGPIKYIAALIYGDQIQNDINALEKAVRWVIILLVLVFDPLALILVIAAISSYRWENQNTYRPLVPYARDTKYPPFTPYIPDKEAKAEIPKPEINEVEVPKPEQSEVTASSIDISVDTVPEEIITAEEFVEENIDLKKKNLLTQLKKKLSLSSKTLIQKLSWKSLTDWSKSPILNLLKNLKLKLRLIKK